MSRWLLVILAVLIAVVAAGSAVAKPSRTVAVGKVQGTEAYLAVTYDGHDRRAFVCNGSARRLPTISGWIEAPSGGRLNGHRFTLEPASGAGGLYVETSGTTTETSIVLNNGEIRSC
jgi:hypothetical protein